MCRARKSYKSFHEDGIAFFQCRSFRACGGKQRCGVDQTGASQPEDSFLEQECIRQHTRATRKKTVWNKAYRSIRRGCSISSKTKCDASTRDNEWIKLCISIRKWISTINSFQPKKLTGKHVGQHRRYNDIIWNKTMHLNHA